MLIDAHCHINSLTSIIKEKILNESQSRYIFVDVSINSKTAADSLALSQNRDFIFTSLGFHPLGEEKFSPQTINRYRSFLRTHTKIVAIGEIGLDYKSPLNFEEQREIVLEFINLAKEFNLPIIIHNRWHNEAILDILDSQSSDYQKIIFHCFSQDKNLLGKILAKKAMVSFSLNILRNKQPLKEALEEIPLGNLLLETDSPYMRIDGRLSTPWDIERVYNYVVHLKRLELSSLTEVIRKNITRIFTI